MKEPAIQKETSMPVQVVLGLLWLGAFGALAVGSLMLCAEAIKIPQQHKDWGRAWLVVSCTFPCLALAVIVDLLAKIELHLRPDQPATPVVKPLGIEPEPLPADPTTDPDIVAHLTRQRERERRVPARTDFPHLP